MYILSKEERYLLERSLSQEIKVSRDLKAIAEICNDLKEYNEHKSEEEKLTSLLRRISTPHVRVSVTKVK